MRLGNVDLVRKRFNPKVKEYSRTPTGKTLRYGYTKRGQSNKIDGSDGERKEGGRMTKKKKDEVMKWKSFTLRLLLLVMVGKRIKEPGIFIVMGWK